MSTFSFFEFYNFFQNSKIDLQNVFKLVKFIYLV